jgi:hypothetical protein
LLWLAAGGLMAAGLVAVLAAPQPQALPSPTTGFLHGDAHSPAYEEPPPSARPERELERLDEALFIALREAGVESSDVRPLQAPADRDSACVLQARLGRGVDPAAVEAELEARLGAAGAELAWRREGPGRELAVSLAGRRTHRLLLKPPEPPPSPKAPPPPPEPAPAPRRPGLPAAALVIDDLGYQWAPAKRLIETGLNLTLSILPHSPFGQRIARLARERGLEVMVHLPMEPRSYPELKPGPGALLTSMSAEELARAVREAVDSVPGAAGANNHMGSAFTEDRAALDAVMGVLAQRGLFFVDSLTSPRSQACGRAEAAGVAALKRRIFLDHDPAPAAVERQLERLVGLARASGPVVAIAHPHQATVEVLEKAASRLRRRLQLVRVSVLAPSTAVARRPERVDSADVSP